MGRSFQFEILSESEEEIKVASMWEVPREVTQVGSWSGGLIQERSFWSRKPSKISECFESEGPQSELLQLRSPPRIVLCRCSEGKLPSIFDSSWEGLLQGGL